MPGKKVACQYCSRVMRSDNLKNHVKIHTEAAVGPIVDAKRVMPIAIKLDNSMLRKKNPKIEALVDSIVNDGIHPASVKPAEVFSDSNDIRPKKPRLFTASDISPPLINKDDTAPPKPEYSDTVDEESPPDYSDIDNNDIDDDDDDVTIDDLPPPDNVKFLPATIEGLRARFEELLKNIAVNRKSGVYEKTGDRNEAVFVLDELKRQGGISRRMYRRYNDFLAESLPVEFGIDDEETAMENEDEEAQEDQEEEKEEEDEMKRIIRDTIDHVIQHDKQELGELLIELRDEVGEEFLDSVSALVLLAEEFLIHEFQDGELLLPLIEERRLELEASPASTSKLLRLKILLDDINNNRRRIQEIFQRIDDADDDENDIWKMLIREGLISDEQFEELKDLENTEVEEITSILKGVKSGQGIPFLPTSLSDLRHTLGKLWTDGVKNKILPVLKELLRRGGMTIKQFSILVNELDNL